MAIARFLHYSGFWKQLGELQDVESFAHRCEIDGEDVLTLSLQETALAKTDRIVWHDGARWREHVVDEMSQVHDWGGESFSYTCIASLQADLMRAHVQQFVAHGVTAAYVVGELLKLTTWTLGDCDSFGTANFEWQNRTVWQCLQDVAGEFGAEFEPVVTMGDYGIATRALQFVHSIGTDNGIRWEYNRNIEGITKEVLAEPVYTAVYGYGKSLDTETDGMADKLTFASINGGLPYVADADALERWGLPDGAGGLMHSFGSFEDSEIDDKAILLAKTTDYLNAHNAPQVGYTITSPGEVLQPLALGDGVQVIDTDFTPPLALSTRVGSYERQGTHYADGWEINLASVTFGTIRSVLPDVLSRVYDFTGSSTGTATITASEVATKLNAASESGGGYVYTLPSGTYTSNVELDENGNPKTTTANMQAVRVSTGGIYAANSVDENGAWVWMATAATGITEDASGNLYYNGHKIAFE